MPMVTGKIIYFIQLTHLTWLQIMIFKQETSLSFLKIGIYLLGAAVVVVVPLLLEPPVPSSVLLEHRRQLALQFNLM